MKSTDILNFTHILLTPIPLTRKQKTESSEGSTLLAGPDGELTCAKGQSPLSFPVQVHTHTHTHYSGIYENSCRDIHVVHLSWEGLE